MPDEKKKIICEECEEIFELGPIYRQKVIFAGAKVKDFLFSRCPKCGEKYYLETEESPDPLVGGAPGQSPGNL